MNPINDDLRALDGLGESLHKIRSGLQPGGPELSFELLVGYIDAVLDAAAMQQVGRNIVTWQAWYDAYWETVGALDDEDQSLSESEQVSGFDDEVQDYVTQDYVDLVAQLPMFAAAVRSDSLGPYRAALRAIICEKWNWPERKKEPALGDEVHLTAALARVLAEAALDMPFPVPLVAAILVKEGLDGLCSQGEIL